MNAREWLSSAAELPCDLAVVGAPIARASISSSRAWTTPAAFRETLERFTTWDGDHSIDISRLRVRDAGDRLGREARVAGLDLCEVDAAEDVSGITVRAMASVSLAFCAGLAQRVGR